MTIEAAGNGEDAAEVPPPFSLSEGFQVTLNGWESDNTSEAEDFARQVSGWVMMASQYLDLSRLERVIFAMDYAAAVADVNKGSGVPPAAPTSNEYGQGAAMAVHVPRDDEIWSVVVIWTPLLMPLTVSEHPDRGLAIETLFHELAHVDDLRLFTRTYPGGWRAAKARDGREAALQRIVNPCQSEYSAQRRSACFAPGLGLSLLDMLGGAMRDVDTQIRSAQLEYRVHGNIDILWQLVESRLTFLFQSIGYGIGHADWVASAADDEPEFAARYDAKLAELRDLPRSWLLDACREAVQPFFSMKSWTGQEVYEPLLAVAERLLNEYGMFTSVVDGRMHVAIP